MSPGQHLPPVLVVAFAATLLAACGSGDDPEPRGVEVYPANPTGVAPAALLDLSHWMLTLPIDETGGTTGVADNISTSELLAGYDSDHFYGSENDGVTFWAPVNGAKTARSLYPRSELREMLDPNNAAVNWAYTDTSQLDATLRVNQVPLANGKITIGQILGYNRDNPDVSELAKLVYEYNAGPRRARLYVLLLDGPTAPGSSAHVLPLRDGLSMAETFSYRIRTEAGQLLVSSGTAAVTAPINPAWADVGLYFRAGAALHATGTSATDGGRVTFFDLAATHP